MSREFVVLGPPQGKARARTVRNRFTGRVQSYTPAKTARYEELVRKCYRAQCGEPAFPPDVPLSVELTVLFPVPCSASGKQQKRMRAGELHPIKKPDADNIAKAICDALNGVAYADDKQICCLAVVKRYEEETRASGVYVRIEGETV